MNPESAFRLRFRAGRRRGASRLSFCRRAAGTALLATVAALAPAPGAASSPPADPELAACLERAAETPDAGFEYALNWEDRGGGERARECQAMALFHRGQYDDAAARLAALAPQRGATDAALAASLYGRAGWSWLRAGRAEKADAMFTAALDRQPEDADLYVDRAFARAAVERYWDVVDDLTEAIARAPSRVDIYIYRAEAYRELGNPGLAAGDLGEALERDLANPDALLLRGNIRAQAGDLEGARKDWRRVMQLDPDAPAARAAEGNLERLETAARRDDTGVPPAD